MAVWVCAGEDGELLPKAFETVKDLAEGLNLMAVYGFANNNMGVTPPDPTSCTRCVDRSRRSDIGFR